MVDEWISTTLGEQISLQRGFDITRAEQREGAVPVVSSGGISSYHDTVGVKGPGVITGRKGVVGSVFYVEGDYWPHDTTLWVKDFHGNDPRFSYYFLRFLIPTLKRLDVGSANPTLNRNHVHPITIVWPPLREQKIIASILGALDDKIELNRKMSATLEAIARALFKSWFVDFDAVRAKAEGRDTGLLPEVAALFPDSFEDACGHQIPNGWKSRPLSEVVAINPTTTLAGVNLAPYLDMSNVPTEGYAVNRVVERRVSSGSRFKNGDTLLARITPCLENGKTAFVDFLSNGEIGWGSTEFIVLRPQKPLPPEYGYLLARNDSFRTFAISKMTGSSGRQRVPTDALASFVVTSPTQKVAALFGDVVTPLFNRISAANIESRTLGAVRDALLPKLISGEIRVKEAERILEHSA